MGIRQPDARVRDRFTPLLGTEQEEIVHPGLAEVDVERPPLGLSLGGPGGTRAEQEDENDPDPNRSTCQMFPSAEGFRGRVRSLPGPASEVNCLPGSLPGSLLPGSPAGSLGKLRCLG